MNELFSFTCSSRSRRALLYQCFNVSVCERSQVLLLFIALPQWSFMLLKIIGLRHFEKGCLSFITKWNCKFRKKFHSIILMNPKKILQICKILLNSASWRLQTNKSGHFDDEWKWNKYSLVISCAGWIKKAKTPHRVRDFFPVWRSRQAYCPLMNYSGSSLHL